MQKLNSIELSQVSDEVLKNLAKNRITTILEFLQEDTDKLCVLSNLSLPQILNIRNTIFQKYSAPLDNGRNLYEKSLSNKKYLSSGITSLNMILGGGIPIGSVIEICGLPDSGKTQLCVQISINIVKNTDNIILYIDTKGDFSAIRIQKILEAEGLSYKDMALIMMKIKVIHIWKMEEIVDLFKDLKTKKLIIENLSLIIVDSLPTLMFQFLGDDNKIGLKLLNTLVHHSKYLAKEFKIAVVNVNIQTRWVENYSIHQEDDDDMSLTLKDKYKETKNRCLGRYWEQIPSLVMLLEKNDYTEPKSEDAVLIKASIFHSNFGTFNHTCILNISRLGVK